MKRDDLTISLPFFYKMTHNLAPLYLSSLVPRSVSNISRYNLRNSNNLQTIDARTTLYYNSFLPSTVRAWNIVHEEAKHSDSINTFKGFLNKDKSHIPKHFYVGNRKAQILHTRLRTNCSSLNLDLFIKNISDSPLCQCGSVENAQHYFFCCSKYQVQRTELMNIVWQYQTKITVDSRYLEIEGDSKALRNIRTSTYQICSIEKTKFEQPYFTNDCNLTPLVRNIY